MLTQFRTFAKSPYAVVLFCLLLISFAVFGISDVFKAGPVRDAVVQAGARTVGAAQFKQMFDNYRKQLEQQNQGQAITTEEAAANGLDRRLLENIAYTESFAALVTKMGLRPSDQQIVEEIRKSASFFDQISGRFDRATYQQRLRENGLTEPQFEKLLSDDIAQNQLVSALAAGLTAPRAYAATLATVAREGRNIEWFAVHPRMVALPTPPTDAQLTAYIAANAPRFTKPETRQITVVSFSASTIAPTLPVSQAEVQKRFDFEKDSLSSPEKRTFIQIPAKTAAAANDAVARLRRGEAPEAVARAGGVQPVVYTDQPKTAVTDRAVGDVAFTMKEGEVRGPVQGSLGLAVVKVEKITPGKVAVLDEVRARIEGEVRHDAAVEKVYEQVKKYEDARTGGASLAEAAKVAGVTPIVVPVPITAQGMTLQSQQTNIPPPMLQSAFSLPQGGESDVQDAGQGEYFAIRVDKVNPSALATLAEAKAPASQIYMLDEMRKRMIAKGEELAGRIRKGEAVAAVARSVGAEATRGADVRRDGAGQALTQPVVTAIFEAKSGETLVVPDDQLGVVVAKVEGVVAGDPMELARGVETQRSTLRNNLFNDIGYAARNAARDAVKPKVDYARARAALSLEPLPATPAPGTKVAPAAPGTKQ
jgi:peptidyl-prolyl cis-trans isomerase D